MAVDIILFDTPMPRWSCDTQKHSSLHYGSVRYNQTSEIFAKNPIDRNAMPPTLTLVVFAIGGEAHRQEISNGLVQIRWDVLLTYHRELYVVMTYFHLDPHRSHQIPNGIKKSPDKI
jgi:hypothetical protein